MGSMFAVNIARSSLGQSGDLGQSELEFEGQPGKPGLYNSTDAMYRGIALDDVEEGKAES